MERMDAQSVDSSMFVPFCIFMCFVCMQTSSKGNGGCDACLQPLQSKFCQKEEIRNVSRICSCSSTHHRIKHWGSNEDHSASSVVIPKGLVDKVESAKANVSIADGILRGQRGL
jgi:hypothetical protein